MLRPSIVLSAGLAAAVAAQDPSAAPPAPEAAPAPLRQLLARGVAAAPVGVGLSFALTTSDGGRSFLAGPWTLRTPGVSGSLKLSLERVRMDSGGLEAEARIRNDGRQFAGGLRLDFLEISEAAPQPAETPAQGSAPGTSRSLTLDSPLFFGDLVPGADAILPFRLEPLGLTPGSPYAVLRGVVTGVIAAETLEIPDSADPVAIDVDGEGRIYAGDGRGQAIFLLDPYSQKPRKILPGCSVTGVAVGKKRGEVYASCQNVPALLRLRSSGRPTWTESMGRALGPIRFGGKGTLYGGPGSVVRLGGLSIVEEVASVSGQPLRAVGFDVDPEGTIWAVTTAPESRLLRIRSAKDVVVIAGPGDGLGAIASPRACRVGPDGGVYVLERSVGLRPPRVTVFDRSGSLLRAWNLPPGAPADLAFDGESRLLVLARRDRNASVSVYRVF